MAFNYSRNHRRSIFRNAKAEYIKQFSARKVGYIDQLTTAHYEYPPDDVLARLQIDKEYWAPGVRFYKLAHKYYGDSSLWWIIPWFNQVPLESDFKAGDLIMIPRPLEVVLDYFR
jgi:hypothetical protein